MATPATGKDVKVNITVDGVSVGIIDTIERWQVEEVVTSIETKPLGRQGRTLDQEFDGWRGSFEVPMASDDVQVARDAIASARELRVPTVINIDEKYKLRNGQNKHWLYRDVKLTFATEVRRGEKVMQRITWESGNERIAL